MLAWLRRLFGGSSGAEAVPSSPSASEGRDTARVRALELEIEELRARTERLTADLARERERAAGAVEAGVEARIDLLVQAVAPALTQLNTQGHLLQAEGRAVQTRDVLEVARRLVRALEDAGLDVVGEVGTTVAFDADQHEPLGDVRPGPGDMVEIRFAGVSYRDRLVRRAGVIGKDA